MIRSLSAIALLKHRNLVLLGATHEFNQAAEWFDLARVPGNQVLENLVLARCTPSSP
jgi:hypothetical protein